MGNKFRNLPTQQPGPSQASRRAGPRNVFRELIGQQPAPKARQEEPQGDLGGFRGDKSGQLLPLTSAAIAEHVKWERGQLTKDVGWTALGTPLGVIIGLFEHKWQFGGVLYAKTLRILNYGEVTRSQWWDGFEWTEGPQASEQMESVYLSQVSIQGKLCLADGKRIMAWYENILTEPHAIDFPEDYILGLGLTYPDCTGEMTVSPVGAINNEYTVSCKVIWHNIPSTQEAVAVLVVNVDGVEAMRKLVRHSPGLGYGDVVVPDAEHIIAPDYLPDDYEIVPATEEEEVRIVLHKEIESIGTIELCVSDDSEDISEDHLDIPMIDAKVFAGSPWPMEKIWAYSGLKLWDYGQEESLQYDFYFRTWLLPGEYVDVNISITYPEYPWTVIHSEVVRIENSGPLQVEEEQVVSRIVADVPGKFMFSVGVMATSSAATLAMPFDDGPLRGPAFVRVEGPFTLDWVVKPYNLVYDGDPHPGIEYEVVTGSEEVFESLAPNVPGARYIFSFADRLIALQDYGDRQSLAWCSDGNLEWWLGPDGVQQGDEGQIWLLDAQVDPIDDLMAGAHIGGGNFALYRKRSIWRGFETGNVAQAIGVVPWITGIGTEFRFSVQIVPGGNIFLGSDSMVYLLNEGGQLIGLGAEIQDELRKHLTSELLTVDYDLVDSLFDSWKLEYWLAIPEDEAEYVTALWILDFGLWMREQRVSWRKRPMPNGVRRLAAVTMLPMPYGTV